MPTDAVGFRLARAVVASYTIVDANSCHAAGAAVIYSSVWRSPSSFHLELADQRSVPVTHQALQHVRRRVDDRLY